MLPSKIYTLQLAANATQKLLVEGRYFKILSATGAVNVVSDFGRLEGISIGQGMEKTPFQYITLTDASGATNNVKIVIGDENFIDTNASVVISGIPLVSISGTPNVAITNTPSVTVPNRTSGAFANASVAVTNASTQIVAANANRKYLLIQNKDAAGIIYLAFTVAATVANGIKLGPGESYELSTVISTQAINAIGSIANNANVIVVEG